MIHCVSTVFGKALGLISDTVSGGIAMGIAQRPAGSIQHFKSAVEQVLSDSVVVVPGCIPPDDGADVIRYRASVLDTKHTPGSAMFKLRSKQRLAQTSHRSLTCRSLVQRK